MAHLTGQSFSVQRGGVGEALGLSGQMGLVGASERSESESWGAVVEVWKEVGKVGKTGLSGASERSSSAS